MVSLSLQCCLKVVALSWHWQVLWYCW